MLRKKQGAIEWLEFELLAEIPHLRHGVFLRHGGVSQPPFDSLNAGGGTGDLPEHAEQNRALIQSAIGAKALISERQTHSDELALIKSTADMKKEECDGLITKEKELGLMIKHADCQAAIFYDPEHHALGVIHAGWRGQVKNIYAKTIAFMQNTFASSPDNLLVGISPSLGPQASEFIHYKNEFPPQFWDYQIKPNYFDLWEISRMQLQAAGILPHHIEIAGLCTYSEPSDFFSYRREKVTGRHATVAMLD
jgi:hypothetical protein